jgi:hypothetical protein
LLCTVDEDPEQLSPEDEERGNVEHALCDPPRRPKP